MAGLLRAADTASDNFKFTDQNSQSGRGLFTAGAGTSQPIYDGAALGFNEAYFLYSYFDMYQATGDTLWLYRLADQIGSTSYPTGTVLGDSVRDLTGEFSSLPGLARPEHVRADKESELQRDRPAAGAHDMITNGSFETYTGSNNLPGWMDAGKRGAGR